MRHHAEGCVALEPRPEGSNSMERARLLKRPRDSRRPGTYKEALTNIEIAIFKRITLKIC
jgi:hypothetical protein